MKKLLLFAPALLFALAGCVKDLPYEAPDEPVTPTPGPEPTPTVTQTIFINEVNCGTKEFEIYNAGDAAVDIAGYAFTKDDGDAWVVPAGKGSIPAKGFKVYVAKNADINEGPSFGLSGTKGFKLCLYKSDDISEDNLVDMIDNSAGVDGFKTVDDGWTLSRETDGAANWVLVEGGTIGKSNGSAPDIEIKIYVNEVNCGTKEFEIYNGSGMDVDIAGYVFKKDDGDDWEVPAGKGNIPSKGFKVYVAKNADINEGPSFGLSGTKGFKLTLYKDGEIVSEIDNSKGLDTFMEVADGTTIGRKTDGADELVIFDGGTIGASNNNGTIL